MVDVEHEALAPNRVGEAQRGLAAIRMMLAVVAQASTVRILRCLPTTTRRCTPRRPVITVEKIDPSCRSLQPPTCGARSALPPSADSPNHRHLTVLVSALELTMKYINNYLLPASILLSLGVAYNFDCKQVPVDGSSKKFDLSALGGRHDIFTIDDSRPPAIHNTTYTINLCKPLEKVKDIKDADQCPSGTNGTLGARPNSLYQPLT